MQYANKLLKKLFRRSYSDKVKGLITESISKGEADIDHVADKLNTSRQTLYRKLKASKLSLSEIAFSLGFGDLSAFSRAFKRWSGESPKEFREAHLKDLALLAEKNAALKQDLENEFREIDVKKEE